MPIALATNHNHNELKLKEQLTTQDNVQSADEALVRLIDNTRRLPLASPPNTPALACHQLSNTTITSASSELLPDDLLYDIFSWCLSCETGSDDSFSNLFDPSLNTLCLTSTLWTLGRVSSRWRAIMLSSPVLWSSIRFSSSHGCLDRYCSASTEAKLLGIQLARSGSVPLTIHWSSSSPCHVPLFATLLGHSSRWARVAIGSVPLTMKGVVMDVGMVNTVPGLTSSDPASAGTTSQQVRDSTTADSASTSSSNPQHGYPVLNSLSASTHLLPFLPSFTTANAPNLTSLRLEANTVCLDPDSELDPNSDTTSVLLAKLPLHQIKHIRIDRPYSSSFLRWLAHTPNLESLTINSATRLKLVISPQDPREKVVLPRLRKLDLRGNGCQGVYGVIESDALRSFDVSAGSSLQGVRTLIAKSSGELRELTLRSVRAGNGTGDEFTSLLRDASYLTSLAVEFALPQPEQTQHISSLLSTLAHRAEEQDRERLAPHLKHLDLYVEGLSTDPIAEFGPTLVKVQQSRKALATGSGLEKIRLLFQVSDGVFSSVRQMRLHVEHMLHPPSRSPSPSLPSSPSDTRIAIPKAGSWLDSVLALRASGCRVQTVLVGQARGRDRWQTSYHEVEFDPFQ